LSPGKRAASERNRDIPLPDLLWRLNKQYPRDRGVLCPLLLNCVAFQEGESFFMGANQPHAYISGDILECMALSDNVVRAGLTPKERDVEVLVEMLDYRCAPPAFLAPVRLDEYALLYRPPLASCAEFEVTVFDLPECVEYSLPEQAVGSILLFLFCHGATAKTTNGETRTLSKGQCFFVPANIGVIISTGAVPVGLTPRSGKQFQQKLGAKFTRANINLSAE
jgi:mannose-6-phosphate isomerase